MPPLNNGSSSSAGVYTGERDNSLRATAAPTSIGAIVGPSHKGPVGINTLVVDGDDFTARFGITDSALTYMHYNALAFLADSPRLYVHRVAKEAKLGGVKVATVDSFSACLPFTSGLDDPEDIIFGETDILWAYGENPGIWNNDLRILVFPDTNDVSEEGFVLNVFEGSSQVPVESYRGTLFDKLDGFGNQLNIQNQIEEGSNRIRILINKEHPGLIVNPRAQLVNAVANGTFTQGSSGLPVTVSDIAEAWDTFSDKEDVVVNLLINAGYTDVTVQQRMLEVAKNQENCFAVLDVPVGEQEAQDAVNWRREVLAASTSYGSLYAPDIKIRDTTKGRDIFIPCSGHVAGVFARTDRVAASWFAPAGITRGQLNVLGLRQTYKQGHRDLFAENQINPLVSLPGQGIVVWGADTLQSFASSLSNINVRRLVSLLKVSIQDAVLPGVFEPNDTFLRDELKNLCDDILDPIKRGRGLYGYQVICDDRNNTTETIANGDVILDVYVDPVLPAKRIHLNAIIPKTGQIKFAQELINATNAA